jgi:hypothetical protein
MRMYPPRHDREAVESYCPVSELPLAPSAPLHRHLSVLRSVGTFPFGPCPRSRCARPPPTSPLAPPRPPVAQEVTVVGGGTHVVNRARPARRSSLLLAHCGRRSWVPTVSDYLPSGFCFNMSATRSAIA